MTSEARHLQTLYRAGLLEQQRRQLLDFPNVVAQARFQRGGDAERFVNPAKVVVHEVLCGANVERLSTNFKRTHYRGTENAPAQNGT